jgi:phage tail sheath protein FI
MILRTDASRGVFKAPAGVTATLTGAVANERRLTNTELDTLAGMNVNVVRPVPGAGIAAMGARTNQVGSTAQYISVRRTLNFVKKRAAEVSRFAIFEPNSPTLWEQLRVANGAFLSELWQIGGLAGLDFSQAFYVKCDGENNTAQTIANGEVNIEIGVAPVFPAEFVVIRVGQFEADASTVVTEEV